MLVIRSEKSVLSNWWMEVDRWMILILLSLIALGFMMGFAASTPVAAKLGLNPLHFVTRQGFFVILSLVMMFGISLLEVQNARRLAVISLPFILMAVGLTHLIGPEIKGATRWIPLGFFSLQPSEFLKPSLIVFTAWMLSEKYHNPLFPGRKIALAVFALSVALLITQPDFGQTILITTVFIGQLVLAGMSLYWLGGVIGLGAIGAFLAYLNLPHVQQRIDTFLDPTKGDTFQVDKALEAIQSGGLMGRGPGEGEVKFSLPDAHSDFIFAVTGEEFGFIGLLSLMIIFSMIVLRGLAKLVEEENPFIIYAVSGLLALFGVQALINMGVNLAVIPNKGMTLPFVSYGGSSLMAMAYSMGLVLAFTKKNRFLQKGQFVGFGQRGLG